MPSMIVPTPGAIYNFIFIDGYDKFNGVYKVAKIMTYDEYVSDTGNLMRDWFTPNDKTESDMESVLTDIRAAKMLKLVQPGSDNVEVTIFVSLYFVAETPDFDVSKYYQFGMISTIGLTKDPTLLNFMKNTFTEIVEATYGITPDVNFVTIEEKWLTDEQYSEIVAARDKSKQKVLNYYSENLRLQKQLSQANTAIKEYEKLIANLQSQVSQLSQQSQSSGG